MFPVLRKTASVCSLIAVIAILTAAVASADTQTYRLKNGMQVILKENHASPMVASVIFVQSGSKYESTYENGITHFLEHLLFDGTTNMSREKLDRSITDLGGYINAFTRKDETAYLVLLPKQYIQFGMAVQADMLFNSIFPDSEMTKERKVVIEEINRDADAPNAPADAYFTDMAYAGTDYSRPVLGYKAFIENIPRAAVVEYWKKYYRPSRMTTLIIGDFNADTMKAAVESVFGAISDTPDNATAVNPGKETITGGTRYDTTAAVASTFINFSFAAPAFGDSSFLAIDMLARYLDLADISPLKRDLMGADPLATDVTVSFVPYDGFSRLEVSIVSDKPAMRDSIVGTVIRNIAAISKASIDTSVLAGIKTSLKCEYVLTSEKLHYYGFMIAPQLPVTGWDFVENYPNLLSKIDWPACQKAAGTWFTDPRYIVTTVRPITDSTLPHYVPSGLTAEQVTKHFDSVKFVERDLSAGYPIKFPNTEAVSLRFDDHAKYVRKVLPNGLVVLIKSSLDSRVFALDVLGKDRTANEPVGKAGITDFVNRCLEKGTAKRSAEQLTRDLAAIGANVTLYDNPWIPYDDRYTTPQYSFFKFETIDEYARTGFKLFAEMLSQPSFDSTEVAKIRQGMLGTLKRDAVSPGAAAKGLFYRTLFAAKPYANPIMGTPESIAAITIDDLRAYHKMYYAPDNIVLAIATNQDPSTIMQWVEETIGTMPKGGAAAVTDRAPIAVSTHITDHIELAKEQMSIYQGGPLPAINSPEASSLEIGISILSERLYSNLREKQGLAYSVGAGSFFDRDFGWYYCSMGTSAQKYKEALDGINLQIDKLRLDGVTPEEIRRSRNQIWGRLLSAKLSRINQAYYMAANEYFGLPQNYDAQYIASLSGVTPQSISAAFAKYIRTDACVTVTAGKKQ
jgi:zinc protease